MSALIIAYPLGGLLFNLISFISRDYHFLHPFAILMTTLGCSIGFFVTKETPVYALSKAGKHHASINSIRHMNNQQPLSSDQLDSIRRL